MFRILRKEVLAPNIYLMDVEAPRVAKNALPGQFLIVRVDEDGERDVHDDFFYFRADGTPSWYLSENVVAWMPLPQPYKK